MGTASSTLGKKCNLKSSPKFGEIGTGVIAKVRNKDLDDFLFHAGQQGTSSICCYQNVDLRACTGINLSMCGMRELAVVCRYVLRCQFLDLYVWEEDWVLAVQNHHRYRI